MEGVGYVMVRLVGEPAFIPLSHSDEHNAGYELLQKFARKWGIKPEEFFPISPHYVGIYIYREEDKKKALEAVRRWHAACGPEIIVACPGYDGMPRWKVGSREFERGRGNHPKLSADGLYPVGQGFVDRLAAVSAAFSAMRSGENALAYREGDKAGIRRLQRCVSMLANYIVQYSDLAAEVVANRHGSGFRFGPTMSEAVENWRARVDTYLESRDFRSLEDMFFEHDGAKNAVHMAVRSEIDSTWKDRMKSLFGDLHMADAALARVSPGLAAEPEMDGAPAMAMG